MSQTVTILIVDDHQASRQTLEALLQSSDYQLAFASSGPVALTKAAELTPDLVLLDVMMPGMDGFEVCRRLRADPHLAEIPVVMVTSLDDRDSRLQGIEAGADDFITKPLDTAELLARVRSITRLNRYRRLLAARTQFEWVIEQANDGYLLVSDHDEVLYINPQARFYLGLVENSNEPVAKNFLALAQKQYHCKPDIAWMNWPTQAALSLHQPIYLVRPESVSSPAFWLQVTVLNQPARLENQYLIQLRDVTASINFQRDLHTFGDAVSHKLRTPLTHILTGLEMLVQAETLEMSGADVIKFADVALRGARRLQEEIKDILSYLDISRLSRIETSFSLADLPQVVTEISQKLGLVSVRLSGHESLETLQLKLSPRAFKWILEELLENAKKFHPQQSPVVEINLASKGDTISLIVADNGLTLSPEQLGQVWKPFYQGEKYFTGETPGMGLGLPTIAILIWPAGGTCRLYNRTRGPGVVVELSIPVTQR